MDGAKVFDKVVPAELVDSSLCKFRRAICCLLSQRKGVSEISHLHRINVEDGEWLNALEFRFKAGDVAFRGELLLGERGVGIKVFEICDNDDTCGDVRPQIILFERNIREVIIGAVNCCSCCKFLLND